MGWLLNQALDSLQRASHLRSESPSLAMRKMEGAILLSVHLTRVHSVISEAWIYFPRSAVLLALVRNLSPVLFSLLVVYKAPSVLLHFDLASVTSDQSLTRRSQRPPGISVRDGGTLLCQRRARPFSM